MRKVRLERGLLQAHVAREIGVIEQCITNWENHRGEPQIRYYPAILAFLGYYPFVDNANSLEGKIARLRRWQGISYKRLGTMLGVDGSTVRAWEQAKHSISKPMIAKIDLLSLEMPEFMKKQYCS